MSEPSRSDQDPSTTPPAPAESRPRRGMARRLASRLATLAQVVGHFGHRQRWFLLPMVLVLLLAGVLLLLTGGLSYVAPFVYSIF
jgi:Family of unknown function (DUF5989)